MNNSPDHKIADYIKNLITYLKDKRILILGFGREGRSSYEFLRAYLPDQPLFLADQNPDLLAEHPELKADSRLTTILGSHYLDSLADFDLILKSPGISFKNLDTAPFVDRISSQLELLLEFFPLQTIGVTATKGKSTTSSLIAAMLRDQGKSVFLLGNIGQPVFQQLLDFRSDSFLVLEMSSHQLEFMRRSPHLALLLNLSEEHLDHYRSFTDYANAKCNIYRHQTKEDFFFYNIDDPLLREFIKTLSIKSLPSVEMLSATDNSSAAQNIPSAKVVTVSPQERSEISAENNHMSQPAFNEARSTEAEPLSASLPDFYRLNHQIYYHDQSIYDTTLPRQLLGDYNVANIMFALAVAETLQLNLKKARETIKNFQPLPHRLELVGEFAGVRYYDNSIGTVPAATIAAVSALGDVDTLIIGGMDRGLDYSDFINFLKTSPISHIICMPKTGHDIGKKLPPERVRFVETLTEAVDVARELTAKGKSCLLSPTAASYGFFKNFEEKGDQFQTLVRQNSAKPNQ